MENKYFTPSVEDIRVGYECETMPVHMHEPDDILWRKCLSLTAYDIKEIEDGWLDIRVPYLTKEQIEAEGWKLAETGGLEKGYINGRWGFSKGNFMIGVRLDGENTHVFWIAKDVTLIHWISPFYEQFRTVLPCRDINTFRYICKLLGI